MSKQKAQAAEEKAPEAAQAAPQVETKAVATKPQGGLLANTAGASPELIERIKEVNDNLSSIEDFKLPRVKMTEHGAEILEGEEPLQTLEVVLLHTKKTNVYYEKPFNKNRPEPPRCFSIDGDLPSKDLKDKEGKPLKPINPTCKGCPKAEFGTNLTGAGKACRNLKPMYVLLGDDAIMPRQLTVTPTSLKAANQYLIGLTERGLSYRKVKTVIEFYKKDPDDKYMVARFKMGGKIPVEKQADVDYLRNSWLSIMSNQVIDQNEFEGGNSSGDAQQTPIQTNGEF